MDVRMVETGELRLSCRVSGDPAGRAVVLLHALGTTGSDWELVAAELARDHRVFVPDLRGHGGSGRPGAYSFELMRDDLGALLDVLELDRVTLVGHSAGGVVGYLYAAKHPERVERLVLEDVPEPRPRDRALPQRPGEPVEFDWDAVTALHAQLADPPADWLTGLESVTAPTLVIGGGLRSNVPQDGVAALARRIPAGRLVTIPAGHGIHAARPVDFTALLRGFLPAVGRY